MRYENNAVKGEYCLIYWDNLDSFSQLVKTYIVPPLLGDDYACDESTLRSLTIDLLNYSDLELTDLCEELDYCNCSSEWLVEQKLMVEQQIHYITGSKRRNELLHLPSSEGVIVKI